MTRRADTGVMRLTGRDVAGLVLCADMTARGTWPHHQAGERPDAPGQGREGRGRGGWFFSHLRRGGTLRGLACGLPTGSRSLPPAPRQRYAGPLTRHAAGHRPKNHPPLDAHSPFPHQAHPYKERTL